MWKPQSNHEQCWEKIPWVVNGRASEAEQRTVLAHAEQCNECREELARHRELHGFMRGNDDVIAAPNASWQKLLARIDEQAAGEPAHEVTHEVTHEVNRAGAALTYPIKRPWLIAALWLQLVAIAALTGALFSSANWRQPEYTTLSTPAPSDRPAAVRVVFAPSAQLNDINELLHRVECDIIAGPSEAGVYTLAADAGKDVTAIIKTLRAHSEVLFAEPSQMAAGISRGTPR